MKKSNLEQDIRKWFRPNMDLTKAPPEIMGVLYGIYKSTLAKKKTGSALRAADPKATRKASRSKTGEHNIGMDIIKSSDSNPV